MIDWNASAAWIALGAAIITPAVTSFLNNTHQRKMYALKRKNDRIDYQNEILMASLSSIGACLANSSRENISNVGEHFYNAYAFLPEEKWPVLNQFIQNIYEDNYDKAYDSCPDIVTLLASSYTSEAKCSQPFLKRLLSKK